MSRFLGAPRAPNEQHDELCTALGEVHTPSGTNVDAQFRDAFANGSNASKKSELQSLDPGHHQAAYRRICKGVEPGREFGERLDGEQAQL